jgi:hypothetical protein
MKQRIDYFDYTQNRIAISEIQYGNLSFKGVV